MILILGYLFLIIFASTAVITIASLPGWINISDWYKKKLFLALIIQVVVVVVLLFRESFIGSNSKKKTSSTEAQFEKKVFNPEARLKASRRDSIGTWYVENDTSKLGYVSLTADQRYMISESDEYFVNEEYEIAGSNFYFRIDSISSYIRNKPFKYFLRFGEGDPSGEKKWNTKAYEVNKTENGKIKPNNGLMVVQQKGWKNIYYIAMGVGEPQQDSQNLGQNNKVQFINLLLLKVNIE